LGAVVEVCPPEVDQSPGWPGWRPLLPRRV